MRHRLAVDESMPGALADALTSAGMDAVDVRDVGLGGHDDDDVLAFAVAEGRAVITSDVGFGSILRYPLGSHAGIVLVRLPETEWPHIVARVVAQVGALDAADLSGNVVVIDEVRVRVRRPPGP